MLAAVSGEKGDPPVSLSCVLLWEYAIPFNPTNKRQMRLVGV